MNFSSSRAISVHCQYSIVGVVYSAKNIFWSGFNNVKCVNFEVNQGSGNGCF